MVVPPYACQLRYSFTLYFLLLFYGLLGWCVYRRGATDKQRALWKGVAVHVLPFWVTSQYIIWMRGLRHKCAPRGALRHACGDFALHWVPLILAVRELTRMCHVTPAWEGVLLPAGLAAVYFAAARWRAGAVRLMYGVPLPALLAVYVPPCLLAAALLWPPAPAPAPAPARRSAGVF